ncbi:phosphotransferase [Motilibacter aurantiacus]|uniref:phosphotransferase n=1 Tax=Motilibacter aurantiacus TaxID=2714955 RepID=UPI00140B7177|nr:phosphotransferase [Motilibacter aurantiacus]NHC47597.1 phosphotransferase [Motilibacter aurantiacus]
MPQIASLDEITSSQGLTVTKVLKEDYDHNVYLVEQGGRQLILKTINDEGLEQNLRRDVGYSFVLATLAAADPSWTLRASAPVATGGSWMLREALDAEPLLDPDALTSEAAAAVGRALADLDRLSPDVVARRPDYRNGAGQPVEDEQHRLAELERWVDGIDEASGLGELDREELRSALESGRQAVHPGFEVWDVKLDDFLGLPEGKVAMYDLEFAHLFGRRHYDVAKMYATLAVVHGEPGPAAALLEAYQGESRLPDDRLIAAFLPVCTETLLAELKDAVDADGDSGRSRAAQARELLAGCLAGRVPGLAGQ